MVQGQLCAGHHLVAIVAEVIRSLVPLKPFVACLQPLTTNGPDWFDTPVNPHRLPWLVSKAVVAV